MKKMLLQIAFISGMFFIPGSGNCQSYQKIDSVIINSKAPSYGKLTFLGDAKRAKDIAESDIKRDSANLFIVGGIVPVVYPDEKNFEQLYHIQYYDYGCMSPDPESLRIYNYTVFDHLKKRYGKKWIKEIRKDVCGFRDWKGRK